MADEQLIKPRELPAAITVFADDAIMTDDGATVSKATPVQIVNAGAPVPTEAEAIAGTDNSKRMTPLTVKQVLDSVTAPSVLRAKAWAESDVNPDPGSPGSQSAKSWAGEAQAAADSILTLTAAAASLPPASQATASYNPVTGVMSFGIPRGEQGIQGPVGPMDPAIYDPNNVEANAFDMDNMSDGADKVAMTTTERDKLDGNDVVYFNDLVQEKWAEYDFGQPKDSNPISTGAFRTPQGLAIWGDTVFIRQRTAGTTHTAEETGRIVAFPSYKDGTGVLTNTTFSAVLNIGHQSLSAVDVSGQMRLIAGLPTPVGLTTSDAVKGISVINWRGAATTNADVTKYQLFDAYGGTGFGQEYCQGLVGASKDGRWLAILSKSRRGDGREGRYGVIYRLADVLAATALMPDGVTIDARSVKPVHGPWKFKFASHYQADGPQEICVDDRFIYSYHGGVGVNNAKIVCVTDFYGNRVREFTVDGPKSTYGLSVLRGNDAAIGQPINHEPEGIDLTDDGRIMLLDHFVTHNQTGASVVSFGGAYYHCSISHLSSEDITPESSPENWVQTDITAGAVPWAEGVNYSQSPDRLAVKLTHVIGRPTGLPDQRPINGYPIVTPPNGVYFQTKDNALVYQDGIDGIVIGLYEPNTGLVKPVQTLGANRRTMLLHDARTTSTDNRSAQIKRNSSATVKALEIRSNGPTVSGGASINYHDTDSVGHPGAIEEWTGAGHKSRYVNAEGETKLNRAGTGFVTKFARNGTNYGGFYVSTANFRMDMLGGADFRIYSNPADSTDGSTFQFQISVPDNAVLPGRDNEQTLGMASRRWSQVFAGTATINTSDARLKEQVADLSEAELRVAVGAKGLLKKFKFKDAVALKGTSARWHFGIIAQDLKAVFEAEGLDPFSYGVLCYDEWDEQQEVVEDGVITQEYRAAGNLYGVRYEELMAFIIAAI